MGPRNVDVKFLHGWANAANHLGGPERLAEESRPAIFRLADRTECVPRVSGLVGIEAATRELLLQLGIAVLRRTAGTDTEGFTLEAEEEFFQLRFAGLRQHQAALGGFAIVNFVKLAEFANALKVAEEINDEKFIRRESRKDGRPNKCRIFAADGFATLGSEQLEADGLDIRAEVESFHIQGERWQLQGAWIEGRLTGGAHTSDSV